MCRGIRRWSANTDPEEGEWLEAKTVLFKIQLLGERVWEQSIIYQG